jgi:hypothetical protein
MKREAADHDYANHKCPHEMTGADYADRTIYARRAAEFQAFNNPMSMNPFEEQQVYKEKQDRIDARQNYIKGIQGRDGGNRVDRYESKFEDGPEIN